MTLALFNKLKPHGNMQEGMTCPKPALSPYSVISVPSVVNPPLPEQLLESQSNGQGSALPIPIVIP